MVSRVYIFEYEIQKYVSKLQTAHWYMEILVVRTRVVAIDGPQPHPRHERLFPMVGF